MTQVTPSGQAHGAPRDLISMRSLCAVHAALELCAEWGIHRLMDPATFLLCLPSPRRKLSKVHSLYY